MLKGPGVMAFRRPGSAESQGSYSWWARLSATWEWQGEFSGDRFYSCGVLSELGKVIRETNKQMQCGKWYYGRVAYRVQKGHREGTVPGQTSIWHLRAPLTHPQVTCSFCLLVQPLIGGIQWTQLKRAWKCSFLDLSSSVQERAWRAVMLLRLNRHICCNGQEKQPKEGDDAGLEEKWDSYRKEEWKHISQVELELRSCQNVFRVQWL